MRRALAACVIASLAACDPAPGATDAGADVGASDAGAWMPDPPAPPVLTPCPSGWREVETAAGVTACDPWRSAGSLDCAEDEAHFPGTDACVRIGTACAADGWPTDLPSGRDVRFVDDDAAAGGDGASRATAYRTITEALAAAPEGAVIAVASGEYDEDLVIRAGQTVWGACVSGTRIVRSVYIEFWSIVGLDDPGGEIRNLMIDAPEPAAISGSAAGVAVRDVVIRGATGAGLFFAGATATVERVVVRDMRLDPMGVQGVGLFAQSGAHVVADHLVIERARSAGIFGSSTAVIEARDVAVLGTEAEADGSVGRGVHAQREARIVLERAVVEESRDLGLSATEGARIEARDLVVRRMRSRASDGDYGNAAHASFGGDLVLARAWIDEALELGFLASHLGSTIDLEDVVITRTRPRENDGAHGTSIEASMSGVVTGVRIAIAEGHEAAVLADGAGTTMTLTDLTVRDQQPRETDQHYGAGVFAQATSTITLERARIEGTRFVGLGGTQSSTVTATDLVVARTEAAPCAASTCPTGAGGIGLTANLGAMVRATRFAIADSALCGVMVGRESATPTSLDLSEGFVDLAPIGACVQVAGYDTARLNDRVEYRRVDIPLQATTYDLPDRIGD